MPAAARKAPTGGSAISSPGNIGMLGSMGGIRQPPSICIPWPEWSIWSISWALDGKATSRQPRIAG